MNLYYQLNFFLIKANRSVLCIFCFKKGGCYVLFLIHDGYGIGLNVEFPNKKYLVVIFLQSRYNGKTCKLFFFA